MNKRILIVEDVEVNRCLLQEFLEFEGYTVCGIPDGLNFFQKIAEFSPQLILLDLRLPQIDGYELLQQLQQSPYRSIPVIIMSAHAFRQEKQKAFSLGARLYLTKPVALQDVTAAIESELAKLDASDTTNSLVH